MSTHEEILEGLATGELSPEREPARSALEGSPELRDRFAALQRIQAGLDLAAEERRAILTAIEAESPTPAEERVLERARAMLESPASAATSEAGERPVRPLPLAVAAAALLGVGLWLAHLGTLELDPRISAPETLGSELRLVAPVGPVDRYHEFRWQYALREGFTFELTVWDEETGEELWTSPRLRTSSWRLPETAVLPARVRWEVWVIDPQGNAVATGASEAFLSR